MVAQGYSQEEGIDYDEIFAPVKRMEAIRIFLAFATYMNFKVYQMDVYSAFLNGKLKEEVYVIQPLSFESNKFPLKVNREPLPEDILGVTIQRAIKEILRDTTQRDIEEILGDTTQRDIEEILGDTTQRDIEEILGDTTQRDTSMYLGNNIPG
ncbi:retrovirus-related pol polyprotein from transposon TNT 1-94 [Tanacetum coccineum]